MAAERWAREVRGALDELTRRGRWRAPRSFDARGARGVLEGHGPVVSFASNDYLGLSTHPAVAAAAAEAVERWGTGSGASRLVTGSRPVHHRLEAELADWKGTEAAVTLPTGFAANLAVLATLGRLAATILSDELNHASIVDGCRLVKAPVTVYRHGDVAHLDALLARAPAPALVVSDTVFSMDGDMAPVDDLIEVCRRHDALVVLDEAHAVLGPEVRPAPGVVQVGTLSKALGSLGGFVAGEQDVVDLLVNAARPYIFTTAPSPPDAAAALASVALVRSAEGEARRRRLRKHLNRLAPGHSAPIVPIVVGSEKGALAASAALLERGLLVPAIRPPTVPAGTSRLRVTVSADHTDEEVERLLDALEEVAPGRRTASTGAQAAP